MRKISVYRFLLRNVSRSERVLHGRSHLCSPQNGTPFLLKSYKRKVPIFKDRTSPHKSAIFADPDSYRFNGNCLCTMTKEEYLDEKSLIEKQ